MKSLLIPLAWALAVLLAVAVLWRLYRGKNVVLRGKWSPRVVRIVAILLVVLGRGAAGAPAEPGTPPTDQNKNDPKGEELPACISPATVRTWLNLQSVRGGTWSKFKQELTQAQLVLPEPKGLPTLQQLEKGLPPKLAAVFKADIAAIAAKKVAPRIDASSLLALYDEMESQGYFDHWLNAYLWRKTANMDAGDGSKLAEIYARMYRHSRLTDTLVRALGEVKPYTIPAQAWRSKASPSPGIRALEEKSVADMLEAAKKLYPNIDGGTWKRDGVALLTVAKDSPSPILLREGRKRPLLDGETIRFGRLDLLETPAVSKPVSLNASWLGRVNLLAKRTISVWQLSELLSEEARDKLKQTVAEALDGDEDAADKLELVLPLAHNAIRADVTESPKSKLAPRLRMLLSLFDDTVMPALPWSPADASLYPNVLEGGRE